MALLLALGGCQDANEVDAMAACKMQRYEKAPASVEGEYLGACMWLKGYKPIMKAPCGGNWSWGLASCYEPNGDLARIRRNIFGK